MGGPRCLRGARLNYAENLLRHGDDRETLVSWNESGRRGALTFAQLRGAVAKLQAALRAAGVGPGDRVAGLLPNIPETVVAMLATASLGAVWWSCSPDFGDSAVLDRFGQIRPKVLFVADGAKYRAAYFERLPGVWCHGDWAELSSHGGLVIHGRSDATLNPGGVRMGSAEIIRQVERLPEVVESLVVAQEWEEDVRVVLFARLGDGLRLDEALRERIRRQVREHASTHHVPKRIVRVADLPRTLNGKLSEVAVRAAIHGRSAGNADALANPQVLGFFRAIPELAT